MPRPPYGLLARADAPGPPIDVDRGTAREEARRELSRSLYTQHEPGPFRRALSWVWEHVFGVLEDVAFRTPGDWVGLTVIGVLLVALVTALWLRLGRPRAAARRRGDGTLFPGRPRTAAEHRAAAAGHAAAGRWTPAVQERMRAVVRSLEERALVDHSAGRTAGEAAAEAGRFLPALADALRAAAMTFDAVTYGGRPADATDYARVAELDDAAAHTRPVLPTPAASGTAAR
ncbi:DUF4129 domain-containing protein [Streptomyces sp. RFCAC02]|uniref:DUF4129 domain-containing protein n=1 Tax=Streptomyces sp. RFCAC02 TaxID=2499143 RepID=UPI001021841E|nr:DUF4129 domain-containing protein [Streptomyces sp. RFCAC02]